MAGDLEDFLRRAAARRQEKVARPAQQPRGGSRAPEYTDSRRERTIRRGDDDAVDEALMAEIVEEPGASLAEQRLAKRQKAIQEAKKKAEAIEAETATRVKKLGKASKTPESAQAYGAISMTGDVREDLLTMLSSPHGIRQALLLKEILERPEHRW